MKRNKIKIDKGDTVYKPKNFEANNAETEEEKVIIIIKRGEEMKFSFSEANSARRVKQKLRLDFRPDYVLNIASGKKVEFGALDEGCVYLIPDTEDEPITSLNKRGVIIFIERGKEERFSVSRANKVQKVKQRLGLNFDPKYVLNIASGRKVEFGKLEGVVSMKFHISQSPESSI